MDMRYIADLEAAMLRRLAAMPHLLRPFTAEHPALPRGVVLTGPRGVGKTTFLLHHIQEKRILYLSADTPAVADLRLYDLVKAIFLNGYEGVIIDEIHFAKEWSLHVKALYDDFPAHSIWISDSSSLVLRSGTGDLSRRFAPIHMPFLSFREFYFLETKVLPPIHDPFISLSRIPIEPAPALLDAFRMYRSIGTRPFYGEGDFQDRLFAILDKTLYSDVPFFLPGITDGNLRLMKAIVGTLAHAAIPRLHVRSLCADWAIGSDKLYQVLEVMESVGVLRIIRIENDTKAKSVGEKLFFADPALYSALNGDIGTAREALVAALCANAGWSVEAARDERDGDFIISRPSGSGKMMKHRIEVGGRTKKPKHADFVIRDDVDYPAGNSIPLWLLGCAY
jgi:predicted AAA+ superfamily ATPase